MDIVCLFSKSEVSWAHPWRRLLEAVRELDIPCVTTKDFKGYDGHVLVIGSWHFEGSDELNRLGELARHWESMIRIHDDWRGDIASQIKRERVGKVNTAITQIFDWVNLPRRFTSLYTDVHFGVNLNALSNDGVRRELNPGASDELFYYGAFRADRLVTLKKYDITLSSSDRGQERYYAEGFRKLMGRIDPDSDLSNWRRHLYAEDFGRNYPVHLPSNRFYEVWRSGGAIYFDSSTPRAGFSSIGIPLYPQVQSSEDVGVFDVERVLEMQARWKLPDRSVALEQLKGAICASCQ